MGKKEAKQQTTFNVGDRVFVSNGSTGGANCTGTVIESSKGWYNIKLDDPEACDKETISARAGSMLLMETPAPRVDPLSLAGQAAGTRTPAGDDEAEDDGGEGTGEVSDDEGQTPAQRMAEALRRARQRYAKTKRPNGQSSASCNDRTARALQDLDPQEVAYVADRVMKAEQGTHLMKYGHLNPGQIRMNSGNRIRAAVKAAAAKDDFEELERIYKVLGILEGDETMEDLK